MDAAGQSVIALARCPAAPPSAPGLAPLRHSSCCWQSRPRGRMQMAVTAGPMPSMPGSAWQVLFPKRTMIKQEPAEEAENKEVAQGDAFLQRARSRRPAFQPSIAEPLLSLFSPGESHSCQEVYFNFTKRVDTAFSGPDTGPDGGAGYCRDLASVSKSILRDLISM